MYAVLPFQGEHAFTKIYTLEHVVTQMQLLTLSGLVFFLFLKMLKRTPTIALDSDWFYRRGGHWLYNVLDRGLNGINSATHESIVNGTVANICEWAKAGASKTAVGFCVAWWDFCGASSDEVRIRKHRIEEAVNASCFPIGMTVGASLIVLLIVLL